jgi:predicted amidohydrolase YtcJ
VIGVALLAALALVPVLHAQRPAPADEIFTGTFITLDSALPRAEAIAVRRGKISAVGTRAHVDSTAGPRTRRSDLPGVVLPGFADAHAHPSYLGELLETIDLRALSKAEIIERVRRAADSAPAGQWVRGSGWDQAFWRPPDYPTAADLDSVSAGHPVLLDRIDGHSAWLNTRALDLAGITRQRTDPAGGRIIRDASGEPSGVLVDSAVALVMRVVPQPSAEVRQRRLRAALARYATWGLTSVHDAGAELSDITAYRALAASGALPLRIYLMAAADRTTLAPVLARGPEIGIGGLLTIRSVKVVLDGALGSRGAQLSAPYADAPTEDGLSLTSDAALDSIIRLASARGFQVNVHAIGDAANRRVLDAFERAGPVARTLRFRVEHVSMLRDEDVPRFARLGVIASMQPVFVGEYSRFADARVGPSRLPWVYRTRDLAESGAVIASGTDYPASDAGDPVSTLFSMVTRRGADGSPANGWLPEQRVSVDVALRSMTAGAAYAAFEERERGAISVGRLADLTVLSADPYAMPADELRTLRVLRTIVGGRTTYRAEDAKPVPGSAPRRSTR